MWRRNELFEQLPAVRSPTESLPSCMSDGGSIQRQRHSLHGLKGEKRFGGGLVL